MGDRRQGNNTKKEDDSEEERDKEGKKEEKGKKPHHSPWLFTFRFKEPFNFIWVYKNVSESIKSFMSTLVVCIGFKNAAPEDLGEVHGISLNHSAGRLHDKPELLTITFIHLLFLNS